MHSEDLLNLDYRELTVDKLIELKKKISEQILKLNVGDENRKKLMVKKQKIHSFILYLIKNKLNKSNFKVPKQKNLNDKIVSWRSCEKYKPLEHYEKEVSTFFENQMAEWSEKYKSRYKKCELIKQYFNSIDDHIVGYVNPFDVKGVIILDYFNVIDADYSKFKKYLTDMKLLGYKIFIVSYVSYRSFLHIQAYFNICQTKLALLIDEVYFVFHRENSKRKNIHTIGYVVKNIVDKYSDKKIVFIDDMLVDIKSVMLHCKNILDNFLFIHYLEKNKKNKNGKEFGWKNIHHFEDLVVTINNFFN